MLGAWFKGLSQLFWKIRFEWNIKNFLDILELSQLVSL